MRRSESATLETLKTLAADAGMDSRTAARILRDAGVVEHSGRRFKRVEAEAVLSRDADPVLLTGHATAARGSGMTSATASLAAARAGSEEMRARKLALDVAVREGRYLRKDAVEEAVANVVTRAKGKFLALGPKVAPKILGVTDVHRIADIVEAEARDILEDLSSLDRLTDEVLA